VLQCVAMRYSVLQCVAVCCSVLQCDDCVVPQRDSLSCSMVQCVAVCCTVLQSVLQCVVLCCSVMTVSSLQTYITFRKKLFHMKKSPTLCVKETYMSCKRDLSYM